jgi:hypothetical protein
MSLSRTAAGKCVTMLSSNLEKGSQIQFVTKLYKTKKHFIIAFAVLGICVCTLKGQAQNLPEEKAFLRSQQKQIDEANNDLDRVYQKNSRASQKRASMRASL